MLLCTIPWTTVCTSLLFTLLFIKSQYTVFLFLYILLFFAHLIIIVFLFFCTSFLHILLSFCTSYCFFAHLIVLHFFYFIAHFTLISPFLTTCMPLCYVTLYNLYSYYFALSTERTWFDYISLLIIPCITIMWQIKKPWTLNLFTTSENMFKALKAFCCLGSFVQCLDSWKSSSCSICFQASTCRNIHSIPAIKQHLW